MGRFYTRGGDGGETSLLGGHRVRKTDPRIAACGDTDELNSAIGLARALCTDEDIQKELELVQHDLFAIGAEIVAAGNIQPPRVSAARVQAIEASIDRVGAIVGEQRTFLLPGGTPGAAALHLARAVCRRAERAVDRLVREHGLRKEMLAYMNRLSSLLYVLARMANKGVRETPPDYASAEH